MTQPLPKTALITGAAKRLGKHIALEMARQGCNIVVHYGQSTSVAEETANDIRKLGVTAITLQCDLADEAAVRKLLPQAIEKIGTVSCVVNSASLFEYDDAASFTLKNLDAHMHANLAAPILLAQALHASTPEGACTVMINLLDQKLFNLNPDFLSYTLSKAGLHTATSVLAQALAPKVRVVGLAPGLTMVSGDQTEQGFAKAHTQTPLGKSSHPDDIAQAVCYLAQAQAITGTTLLVDGGQHLIPMQRDVMFVAK
jgi:NAD(P)-dependent dehydrogenase (short-subunit alcohol dehydrogenase family)